MLTLHHPATQRGDQERPIGPAPWITTPPPGPMTAWAAAHDRRALAASPGWPYPLVVQRSRGSIVEDLDGNRYLDFTAGTVACPTGHCHPHIIEAVQEQIARLTHACSDEYTSRPMMALAEAFTRIAPGEEPKRVLLTNTPFESLKATIQIARQHTGRTRIVTFVGASHNTMIKAVTLATGKPSRRQRAPSSAVDSLPYGHSQPIQKCLTAHSDQIAAIFVEPMLTHDHYETPPAGFLTELRSLCDTHGCLLVIDETYTGMGRTGRMFGCEHEEVVPDLLLTTNGLSSGMSVNAVIADETIFHRNVPLPPSTFIGNPISCTVARTMIELLEKNLVANAAKIAPVLADKLRQIAERHRCIGPPTGHGLLLAIDVLKTRGSELSAPELRDRLASEAFSRGLLLWGIGETAIRFTPPLCINRVQVDVGLDVFEEAIATVCSC